MKVVVKQKKQLTKNVVAFELASIDSTPLPSWSAGAHIEIHLPNGLLRQYSLCGSPQQPCYEVAVLKEEKGRGGSIFLCEQVAEGQELIISEPKNHFRLDSRDKKRLFFAAGIGITPVLAMAESSHLIDYDLVMCAKNADAVPYLQRIKALKGHSFHYSEVMQQRLYVKQYLETRDRNSAIYVCGPQRFIDDILVTAKQLGWPDTLLHKEYFGLDFNSAATNEDKAFYVKIQSSGAIISVEKNQTLLQALEENGLFIPVACEEGVCGTCMTTVVEGEPDHRDVFLTDEEKASGTCIMPCCSRAKSELITLDL